MAENYYRVNANIFMPQVNWVGPGPSYQGREFQTVTYITALLYRVLGEKDWLGRVVAIAFGLWGIFALYQLIRQVWSEAHGLAGAAVMAVLPGSVIVERSFLPDPAHADCPPRGIHAGALRPHPGGLVRSRAGTQGRLGVVAAQCDSRPARSWEHSRTPPVCQPAP